MVPASWVGTDRLYGNNTLLHSSIIQLGPTPKPRRTPASDHTFEYVRTTKIGDLSSTRSSALQGANSPYASSTTSTAPCAAAASARCAIVAGGSTVPVGLLGLHTNTTDGRVRAMVAAASSASSE